MKKIVSILLCIVLVCFSLVSCKEKIIGEDLKYRDDNKNDNVKIEILNMYIVVGENTSPEAMETVPSNINAYLKETYQVHLNIVYCTPEEYSTAVLASVKDGVTEADRADIVLINDIELFEELYNGNKLAVLTDFYNDKNYQKLNAIVEDKLLAASLIKEVAPGQENVEPDKLKYVYNYYTVPNNHVIGQYEYIVIDKARARDELNFSSTKIAAMNYVKDIEVYQDAIGEDYVKLCLGNYEMKLLLEYGCETVQELENKVGEYYDAHPEILTELDNISREKYIEDYSVIEEIDGEYKIKAPIKKVNFVNVASYPNATATEAFSSAYAIIKSLNDVGTLSEEDAAVIDKHYSKCMDIIFALNNDVQLRNMLQYGYVGTNYTFIKDKNQNTNKINLRDSDNRTPQNPISYDMNITYTGNPYIAYYCDDINWNSSIHSNVLKQNAASYTLEEKLSEELAQINTAEFDLKYAAEDTYVSLKRNGTKHGDVELVWSTDSEGVEIVDNVLKIAASDATTPISITLNVTLMCVDTVSGESAEITTVYTVDITAANVAS